MKTYIDCIPCFFDQALKAARMAGANQKMKKKIVDEISIRLPEFSLSSSPSEFGRDIYALVKKITKKKDPFKKAKQKSTKLTLQIYGSLKKKVAMAHDPLLMAVELAIAGNIIDFGLNRSVNIKKEIAIILRKESRAIKKEKTKLFNYPAFKSSIKRARTILYIGDNVGEATFDRILIEEILRQDAKKKIAYAVKEKPIINDVLMEDARACGLHKIANVISSGVDAPGTIISLCNKEFLKVYREVDMIISKGQGNFETLSEEKMPIFFLFMAKCPVAARDVGCAIGDIILLYKSSKKRTKRNA